MKISFTPYSYTLGWQERRLKEVVKETSGKNFEPCDPDPDNFLGEVKLTEATEPGWYKSGRVIINVYSEYLAEIYGPGSKEEYIDRPWLEQHFCK